MAGGGQVVLRTLSQQGWVRGSGAAVLSRLQDAAVVRPGFLSAAEEETLSRELEPELRRRRYEYDHWDAVRRVALGRSHRGVAWDIRDRAGVERWVGGASSGRGLGMGARSCCLGSWLEERFGDVSRAIRRQNRGVFGGQDQS